MSQFPLFRQRTEHCLFCQDGGADRVQLVGLVVKHLQMRVRDAADDLFAPEDVLGDLCSHQVHGVILAHSGHRVAVLHAALLEDVGVGGVAHKGCAAKGIIIKAVQPLELLGVLFDQGNIMADAFQIPHQCRAHLVAADHQNIHGCHLIVQNLLLSGPAVRVRRKHR